MPDDSMKNKDRDEEHRRRREVGEESGDPEKEVDGREVAAALYGGPDHSDGATDTDTDTTDTPTDAPSEQTKSE
jgi:hypothetical protein